MALQKENHGIYENEHTFVFINGQSLSNCHRAISMPIDYKLLHSFYANNTDLGGIHYFNVLPSGTSITSHAHPLIKFLGHNNFQTHVRYADVIPAMDERPARMERKSLTSAIMAKVLTIVSMAKPRDAVQRVVLIGCEPDYEEWFPLLSNMGVRVTLVGLTHASLRREYGTPEGCRIPTFVLTSPKLREGMVDTFVELASLREIFFNEASDKWQENEAA